MPRQVRFYRQRMLLPPATRKRACWQTQTRTAFSGRYCSGVGRGSNVVCPALFAMSSCQTLRVSALVRHASRHKRVCHSRQSVSGVNVKRVHAVRQSPRRRRHHAGDNAKRTLLHRQNRKNACSPGVPLPPNAAARQHDNGSAAANARRSLITVTAALFKRGSAALHQPITARNSTGNNAAARAS